MTHFDQCENIDLHSSSFIDKARYKGFPPLDICPKMEILVNAKIFPEQFF